MRKLFLIGSAAALSFFAVGCVSAESVCESGVELACDRAFECQSEQVKGSDAFKSVYGTSASECKTKLTASQSCAAKKDVDELCTGTNAGKKYDLGNASDCSDAKKKQSCADYLDSTKTPSVCAQICT